MAGIGRISNEEALYLASDKGERSIGLKVGFEVRIRRKLNPTSSSFYRLHDVGIIVTCETPDEARDVMREVALLLQRRFEHGERQDENNQPQKDRAVLTLPEGKVLGG